MKEEQMNTSVVIAGAGAAGLMAAARLKELGVPSILIDSADRAGRKIYATGNGKCNLTNDVLEPACYHSDAGDVTALIHDYSREELKDFFTSRGILLHERKGYYYPRTDQASTIVHALEREALGGSVRFLKEERVRSVSPRKDRGGEASAQLFAPAQESGQNCRSPQTEPFLQEILRSTGYLVTTDKRQIRCQALILALGGKVAKAYGCNGDGLRIAGELGLEMDPVFPSLVPLFSEDPILSVAAGVRTQARVQVYVEGVLQDSNVGEVQFLKNGISGIPVFQVSHAASRAVHVIHRPVTCTLDFIPEMSGSEFEGEITRRLKGLRERDLLLDLFLGLVPDKIASMVIRRNHFADEKKIVNIKNDKEEVLRSLLHQLKSFPLTISGTDSFDKAQVTGGGVLLREVDNHFMARKRPGLFLAGEILNVDGICGGYNLTFAMCSGRLAADGVADCLKIL